MSRSKISGRRGLDAISDTTRALWYRVNEKYGEHVYSLGVNGLDQVALCKGYGEAIVVGNNRQVQKVLRDLLKEEIT